MTTDLEKGSVLDGATVTEPEAAEDSDEWAVSYKRGDDGMPDIAAEPVEDPLPKADEEGLCCLLGPCRGYTEQLTPSGDMGAYRVLRRYCKRIPGEGGDWNELTEGVVLACGEYSPPLWSIDGWLWKWKQRAELREARAQLAGQEEDSYE